jgi:hypothetical protein
LTYNDSHQTHFGFDMVYFVFIEVLAGRDLAFLTVFSYCQNIWFYRAFHGFGKVKFSDGDLVLGSSQFSILRQLPPKILLN